MFVNNPRGQTKILATHALNFLPQVDCIYTTADSQIKERGTYTELMANDGVLSKFLREFSSRGGGEDASEIVDEVEGDKQRKSKEQDGKNKMIM